MIIRQIRSGDGTGTLSYIVACETTRTGVIVDPNIEDLEETGMVVDELGIRISHIIDTHTHADHISGAGELRRKSGALTVMHANTVDKWKNVDEGDRFGIGDILRANARIPIDCYVLHDDVINVGSLRITVLFTPGHTDNHISLRLGENLFTGDLLLVGQAGRSDLPGGNPEEQYDSLFDRILPLPDSTRIYPGHDYQGVVSALLGEERRTNPFLHPRTKQAFVRFVSEFFPPLAEGTAKGGRMTLQCGVQRVVRPGENIRDITPQELHEMKTGGSKVFLLDVREPVELVISGAIEGVCNVPIGSLGSRKHELPENKSMPVVCVCQSGARSAEAARYLRQQGYGNVMNLAGGTSGWLKSGFPLSGRRVA